MNNDSYARRMIGTLALIALMSAVVAKFFSAFAFADTLPKPPRVLAPSAILGVYRVADVQERSRSHNGTICSEYREDDGTVEQPDSDCGELVLAVQTRKGDKQSIALLRAKPSYGRYESFQLVGSLFSPKCDAGIDSTDLTHHLQDSKLCRAFHSPSIDRDGGESYLFYEDLDPTADALTNALVTMAFSGLPIGISRMDQIDLPAGDSSPNHIKVTETVKGFVLFIPATIIRTYDLARVN